MKSIRLCFVLLLVVHVAFPQTKKWEVGIIAGPNLSFLYGNEVVANNGIKPTLRYTIGTKLIHNFNNSIGIEANLSYERKGISAEYLFTDATGNPTSFGTIYHYYDYFSVPLLLKPSFGKRTKFFFIVGPNFSYLFKNTEEIYDGSQLYHSKDMTMFDNRFDLGLTAGIGIIFPISERFNFSTELRNNLGLLNVSKLPVYGGGTVQANSTNLLLGVSYKL